MKGRARGRGGFTLVEVLVGMVVTGAVVAGAYALLGAAADTRTRVARERAEAFPGAAARGALEAWLAGATLLDGGGPFVGTDRRSGPFPLDEVAFAVEDGGALHPGPRRVRLWVERSSRAPHVARLAEVADLRPRGREPVDTLELARFAGGLSVRYRAVVQGREQWVDSWSSDRRVPDAVELTVLPSAERAADPRGDGVPPLLKLPVVVRLRTDVNRERADEGDGRPAGVRVDCGALGARAGVCAGD